MKILIKEFIYELQKKVKFFCKKGKGEFIYYFWRNIIDQITQE